MVNGTPGGVESGSGSAYVANISITPFFLSVTSSAKPNSNSTPDPEPPKCVE